MKKYHKYIIVLFLTVLFTPDAVMAASSLKFTLSGLTGVPLENAEAILETAKNSLLEAHREIPDLTPADIQTLYERAPEHIHKAIEPFGLFRAIVRPQGLVCRQKQCEAFFAVTPGIPLPVASVHVILEGSGKHNPALWRVAGK
jgi:hypothetical protein